MKRIPKQMLLSLFLCFTLILSLFPFVGCSNTQSLNKISTAISEQTIDGISLTWKSRVRGDYYFELADESLSGNLSTGDYDFNIATKDFCAFYRKGHLFTYQGSAKLTQDSHLSYVRPHQSGFLVFDRSQLFSNYDFNGNNDLLRILFGSQENENSNDNLGKLFRFLDELHCISLQEDAVVIDLLAFSDRFMSDLYTATRSSNTSTTLRKMLSERSLKPYVDFLEETLAETERQTLENELKEALGLDEIDDLLSTRIDPLFKERIHEDWKEKFKSWNKSITKEQFYIKDVEQWVSFSDLYIKLQLNEDQTLAALSVSIQGEIGVETMNNKAEWEISSATIDANMLVTFSSTPYPIFDVFENPLNAMIGVDDDLSVEEYITILNEESEEEYVES